MKSAPVPSEKASVLVPLLWVAGLSAILIPVSRVNYPLFHTLAELFSISTAAAAFALAWNSRHIIGNGYLLILGIASLFVGGIDLLHTLAYRGVALFPGFDDNLPTQLWIASRSLLALSLLVAPFFLARKPNPVVVLGTAAALTTGLLLSIFVWRVFPPCFVEGQGLTVFKVGAEYVIGLVLVAALLLLWRWGTGLERGVRHLLSLFIGCSIAAELAFTTYASVYGPANLAGHLLKIAATIFLYQALLVTGLNRPLALLLRDLSLREQELRKERNLAGGVIDAAPAIIILLDHAGRIVRYNHAMERFSGITSAQAVGLDWLTTFVPAPDRGAHRRRMEQPVREGTGNGEVHRLLTRAGREMLVRMLFRTLPGSEGEEPGILLVGLDMTETLRQEKEREALIRKLEGALADVKTLSGMFPLCSIC